MSTPRTCALCGRTLHPFRWWQWPGMDPQCSTDRDECYRRFLTRMGVKPEHIKDTHWKDLA